MLRLAWLFALVTVVQDAPPPPVEPEIRGVVVDFSNLPLEGVEVMAAFQESAVPSGKTAAELTKDPITSKTGVDGKFALHPNKLGAYLVWTHKDGHVAQSGTGTVNLTASTPVKEVRFSMGPAPNSEITGRVVDDETGKPLVNFPVAAVGLSKLPGRYLAFRKPGVTDSEGKFAISGLAANDYLVEISPRASGKERVVTSFAEEDTQKIDVDWEHSFWPGGRFEDTAAPIAVPAGATVDVGRLRVRKAPYYRVAVRIPRATCGTEETKITLTEYIESFQMDTRHEQLAQVPCGHDVLLTGYARGSYRLVLTSDGEPETRITASVPVMILNKNVEVVATPSVGVSLEGMVIAADGAHLPDLSRLTIQLEPIAMLRFPDLTKGVHPGSDGKFRLTGVPAVNEWLRLPGLGSTNYVKEIRYNGARVTNVNPASRFQALLPMEANSLVHAVTIVLDDKPARITGTVTDGDQPANKPFVILAKWPPATTPFRILSSIIAMGDESPQTWNASVANGDAKGQFQFTGLTPGEYRIVALRTRAEDEKRPPGVLEQALASGKKVEVSAGGLQNLILDVTPLR